MSELSKQAGVLSAAEFFRFFVKTIVGIALARLITPSELGTYRQLFLIYTTLAAVLTLGIPQSLLYFIPRAKDAKEQTRIIKRTLNLIALLALLCSAIIFFGRDLVAVKFNNPSLYKLLVIYAFYPLFMFVTQIYSSIMLGLKAPLKAATFTIFSILSDLILILGTALFTRNLFLIVVAVLVSAFFQCFYAWFRLYRFERLNFTVDLSGLKSQLSYAVPLGLSSLVGMLSIQLDKIMVSGFFTPEQFAVFSVGAMELPLIGILANSVNSVILPNLSSGDKDQMGALYSATVRKNSLLVFPLAVLFFLLADPLMVFLYGAPYAKAASYFRIYLYALPLRIATYGIIFQAMGKTKVMMLNSIIALIANAGLNFLLIRKLGMQGAALATVLVTWITVAIYLIQMKHFLHLKLGSFFPLSKIISTFMVSVFAGLLCYPLTLVTASPIFSLTLCGSFYLLSFLVFGRLSGVILDYDLALALSFFKSAKQRLSR